MQLIEIKPALLRGSVGTEPRSSLPGKDLVEPAEVSKAGERVFREVTLCFRPERDKQGPCVRKKSKLGDCGRVEGTRSCFYRNFREGPRMQAPLGKSQLREGAIRQCLRPVESRPRRDPF